MKWNDLSMAQKSELMKIYVSNGITDLNSIIDNYNKFDEGGNTENDWRIKDVVNWMKSLFTKDSTSNTAPVVQGRPSFPRVRENDSPTRERSEAYENTMYNTQQRLLRQAASKGVNSDDWIIPYDITKEIKVPGVGRISTNALDSLALNAIKMNFLVPDAFGLSARETVFGGAPNTSIDAYTDRYPKKETESEEEYKNRIKVEERAIHNSSYFRNFGVIHPQFLVNNHEWSKRGYDKSKYGPKLKDIASPLQHAYTLFDLGLYNPGEKNHTSEVKNIGQQIWNTPIIQEWWADFKSRYPEYQEVYRTYDK